MRIVILQGAFFPVPAILGGAVEKIWYRMGQEFVALGHEVLHIGCTHTTLLNSETINGVQYIRVPGYNTPASLVKLKFLDLLYSIQAIKKIPKNVDIIVTNTFWSPLLLQRRYGKKIYIDVQRVPRGQMKLYRNAGMLRGCSPSIYEAIKREMPYNLKSIVSYIPNPVPFDVKEVSIKREKIILFVGRLHPEKGIHILLESFLKIRKDLVEDWKVIIVGSSDYKSGGGGNLYLQQLVNIAADNNVGFVGPIFNDDELIKCFARASIFCYPAQQGSGDAAPVAPREAMAYGCVPLVSKLDCFSDLISDGKNGVVYDHNALDQVDELSEALSHLMSNDSKLRELSEEAKLISQRFSPKKIAKQFIKDFEKLHSSSKKRKDSLSGISL